MSEPSIPSNLRMSYFSYDRSFDKYFINNEYRSMLVDVTLSGMIQMDLHLRNKFYKKLFTARHEIITKEYPNRDEIVFYNPDGSILAKSEYQILGSFNVKEKFWQWAWSFSVTDENEKKQFYFVKKLFDIASDYVIPYIRFFFLTSVFYCQKKAQFDVFISLCRGFIRNPYVIMYTPYKTINEDICIVLTDIEGMNKYWNEFNNKYMEENKYEFQGK